MKVRTKGRKWGLFFYFVATALILGGGGLAAAAFPGGYDWAYTVASALASQKHNPTGSKWFAGGVVLGTIFLGVALSGIRAKEPFGGGFYLICLWVGVVGCGLVGLERLLLFHFSDRFHKGHELLALLAFLGLYIGVGGLIFQLRGVGESGRWPVFLLFLPLSAILCVQLWLYYDQRDLGWVDPGWREKGVPVWLSFAFWQWWAMVGLWLALGWVVWKGRADSKQAGGSG